MTSSKPATVYVSLGSNIAPHTHLMKAVHLLEDAGKVEKFSAAYITPPEGFTEQDDFWNVAVRLTTGLAPITLKHEVLDAIEQRLGRVRDPNNKNAPRTIDLDISLWNDEIFEYGEKPWRVPDPDILRFPHVVVPLANIAPDYIHPVEKITLAQIAKQYDLKQLGFSRSDDWFEA
jgi:2-amino-4-hydroxy-6-hydroxymethyldihydropteridine diphosphokinase